METVLSASSLRNTVRVRPGNRMWFRLTAKETNNALSVIDVQMTPGSEPPRHVHQWEDETIIIHEGTATFFVGNDIINAKKGDVVFMPRMVPHHFVITSATAHCTLIATPGGIEAFFSAISSPFDQQFVPVSERPSAEAIGKLVAAAEKFGITFAKSSEF
jgi:quercetin dioxygenase-like cupin family protein